MTTNQSTRDSLAQAIREYANTIKENFNLNVDAQPEDQLKQPVAKLVQDIGSITGFQVNHRTETPLYSIPNQPGVSGRPDIGVTVSQLLIGHIELKRPGKGAKPENFKEADRNQWNRFKALPNLIYTDGEEWSLYREGERKQIIKITDDITKGNAALQEKNLQALEKLCIDFLCWQPIVPRTFKGLAEFLAPLARLLKDEVAATLSNQSSRLSQVADEWRSLLFPDASDEQFADAYAQTLTHALLLARFEGAESLTRSIAVDILNRQHGLLAQALNLLEFDPVREELITTVELLERAIQAIDTDIVSNEKDPWLYFYEHFLAAYDPKLRKERGVYYTPLPVVNAQVRFAAEILQKKFNKPLAFAEDDVTVLDPAAGTGTYPLAVIEHAAEVITNLYGPGAVQEQIQKLAKNLYAFELLVGAYSVAHLRISQRLRDLGAYDIPLQIYLTDTLDSPNASHEFRTSMLQERLVEEHEQARNVKKNIPIFVCLGNPPYNREQHEIDDLEQPRKGGWVRYGDKGSTTLPILEDFLKPVRDAGNGVHLKNIYNDYVYFWRWAIWKVLESNNDAGIVTFITASSYLRGPGFAGMRQKMRETFDELWIIDLEGDSIGARKTPNIFSIRSPVAIAIGVRHTNPHPERPATVKKTKLIGNAEEKLNALDNATELDDLQWDTCSEKWDAPFFPDRNDFYSHMPPIIDIFPWQRSGVKAGRTWVIAPDEKNLSKRWTTLVSSAHSDRPMLFVDRATGRKTQDTPVPLINGNDKQDSISSVDGTTETPPIWRYSYRTFDRQWILADSRLLDRPGPMLWRAHGDKQTYITSMLTNTPLGKGPAAIATGHIPDLHHFSGRGAKDVIPLWRDPDAKHPNITKGLLEHISQQHDKPVSPQTLLAYTYAILANPAYIERFWDELELPPPRIPITKNPQLFQEVARHGEKLIHLHTYAERFGKKNSIRQGKAKATEPVSLDSYPTDWRYDERTKTIYVGEGQFAPVSREVFFYSVSGLQIVKSWLDRRKLNPPGKKSSPLDEIRPEKWTFTREFLELLWLLEHTIELQPKGAQLLDQVCESPLFSDDELPKPTPEETNPPNVPQSIPLIERNP